MGLGDFITGIFGSENEEKAAKPAIDSNAYNYGGYEGGATDAAMRYRENASNAQKREAAQADYGQANASTKLGLQARGDMNTVGQAQLSRALGKTPSIAGMQADRQMGQAVAAQGAMQASARGRGGLANAATAAAGNIANTQQNISGQAQINAAQERAQAEQAAAGTFANMQGLDAQRTGQQAQMAQYQSSNQMQQRALNDAMTSDQLKNEIQVQGMQLGAQQNLQAQNSSNSLGASAINAGVGGQNAATNQQNALGFLGMAGQAAGGLAGGLGGKAEGGPVRGGKPYVMGERGPEMVIDLDEPVIDLDDSMDADEYVESKFPKPYEREGFTRANSRAEHEAEVQARDRAVQDKAGRDADAMMAGFRAGLLAGPSVRADRGGDTRIAARAHGGPVEADKPYLVGENGPEIVTPPDNGFVIPSEITVPMLAQSTWGGGEPDRVAQKRAYDEADAQGQSAQRSTEANKSYVDPYQRDVNEVRTLRAITPSLVDDDDMRRERVGKAYMRNRSNAPASGSEDKTERAAVSEGKAVPKAKQGKIASALGTLGEGSQRMSRVVDTSYHGPTSISGPQLIPISGSRAGGGPIGRGLGYLVGERGPEMVIPAGATPSDGATIGGTFHTGTSQLGPGGGMDILSQTKWNNRELQGMAKDPTGGMAARADGGEVEPGKSYLVGERGPEAVVPLSEDEKRSMPWYQGPNPTEQQPAMSKAEADARARSPQAPSADAQRAADDEDRTVMDRVVGFVGGPSAANTIRDGRRHDRERLARTPPPQEPRPDLVPMSAFLASMFGGR